MFIDTRKVTGNICFGSSLPLLSNGTTKKPQPPKNHEKNA